MKKMKILTLAAILFFSVSSFAQDQYKAEMEGWLVSLEEAVKQSEETGKPILTNFTGSDWCGWCKKLRKNVWDKQDFKDWAKDNVILLELDFPRSKVVPTDIREQNVELQRQFGVRGYPTIHLLVGTKDENGKIVMKSLGKTNYPRTTPGKEVEVFIGALKPLMPKGE